ncbi:hypothetical protein [Hydrogenophaga sp. PBL-H3]|nr:hypothetical protein [Hydrogenophaga sp. PBL-H3]
MPDHLWEHLRRWLGNDWGFKRLALNGGGMWRWTEPAPRLTGAA